MMAPQVMDFEQFATLNGAPKDGYTEPGLHVRGQMSDAAHRRAMADLAQSGAAWQEKRNKLRVEFAQKVAQGEIREPTRIERMIRTAQGHPDNPAVQAARRLLEKRGISYGAS